MKQRISEEDVRNITSEQQDKLRVMWAEHQQQGDVFICPGNDFLSGKSFAWDGHNKPFSLAVPILSIGQCLEIILENSIHEESDPYPTLTFKKNSVDDDYDFGIGIGVFWEGRREGVEFIDALWEAILEIL